MCAILFMLDCWIIQQKSNLSSSCTIWLKKNTINSVELHFKKELKYSFSVGILRIEMNDIFWPQKECWTIPIYAHTYVDKLKKKYFWE